MKGQCFDFVGSGGTLLPAVIWRPENVRAVLQVAHGTTEHMGRYEAFATAMEVHGIAVAGFDLRGHGRNPGDPAVAEFHPGDWQASVQDVQLFREHLGREFPEVPPVPDGLLPGILPGSGRAERVSNGYPVRCDPDGYGQSARLAPVGDAVGHGRTDPEGGLRQDLCPGAEAVLWRIQ